MKNWTIATAILISQPWICMAMSGADLKGRITGSNGEAVDFAAVRVYTPDSVFQTGTMTDSEGKYRITGLAGETAIVSASCLGYDRCSVTVRLHATGETTADLVLPENSTALGEVQVTARRFNRTSEGVTIKPDRQQVNHSLSGYDLIRNLMIPGVSVSAATGAVTALGGEVKIYIDGMEADVREIRQLRPEDVANVQYIDAPTGKYAGQNVVINFVLKKQTSGGYAAIDAMQRTGYTNGDYNIASQYNDGNTRYTLYAGTDYRIMNGNEQTRHETIAFPDGTINRDFTTSGARDSHNTQYGQFRVRHKNDRRTLRVTLGIVRDATPENSRSSRLAYTGGGLSGITSATEQTEHSRGMKYSLGLSGTFNLPAGQIIEASASASLATNRYDYSYAEGGSGVNSSTREKLWYFTGSARYVKQFAHGNTLALKLDEIFNVSSADYSGTTPSWQHLWMSESILFAEYSHRLSGKTSVSLAPGLSAQSYRLHGHAQVNNFSPRASASFTLQPSKSQFLQLRAVYGNSYPQLAMLTNVVTQVDLIQEKQGNPDLGQSHIWGGTGVYGIGIGKCNLQASVIFTRITSLPVTTYSIRNERLYQTFAGDGSFRQFIPSLSLTWMPRNQFNIKLTGGWHHSAYNLPRQAKASTLTFDADLSWYFRDFALMAYARSPRKDFESDMAVFHGVWEYGLSLGWSRKAFKAEIGARNPFYRYPVGTTALFSPIFSYDETRHSAADSQTTYLKISYSLDFGKKTSHASHSVDKSINSGILRAR